MTLKAIFVKIKILLALLALAAWFYYGLQWTSDEVLSSYKYHQALPNPLH